jgi:hypothetical protein
MCLLSGKSVTFLFAGTISIMYVLTGNFCITCQRTREIFINRLLTGKFYVTYLLIDVGKISVMSHVSTYW